MSRCKYDATRDDFNAVAWANFVQFAWSQREARVAFTEATGIPAIVGGFDVLPIEHLIDEATGRTNDIAAKFVEWVTRTQWGIEYAPKAYRDATYPLPTPSSSFVVEEGDVHEVHRQHAPGAACRLCDGGEP